jgi:hypothetical protein
METQLWTHEGVISYGDQERKNADHEIHFVAGSFGRGSRVCAESTAAAHALAW